MRSMTGVQVVNFEVQILLMTDMKGGTPVWGASKTGLMGHARTHTHCTQGMLVPKF